MYVGSIPNITRSTSATPLSGKGSPRRLRAR